MLIFRDLFYERKNLFKVQPTFNRSLKAICKFLGSNRKHLRVVRLFNFVKLINN